MGKNDTDGWVFVDELAHDCTGCSWALREGDMVCCEFGQREFPKADDNCHRYIPLDVEI